MKAVTHGAAHEIEIEMAVGVTDVEDDTALVSLADSSTKPAFFIHNRGLLRRIAVSHNVARSKVSTISSIEMAVLPM